MKTIFLLFISIAAFAQVRENRACNNLKTIVMRNSPYGFQAIRTDGDKVSIEMPDKNDSLYFNCAWMEDDFKDNMTLKTWAPVYEHKYQRPNMLGVFTTLWDVIAKSADKRDIIFSNKNENPVRTLIKYNTVSKTVTIEDPLDSQKRKTIISCGKKTEIKFEKNGKAVDVLTQAEGGVTTAKGPQKCAVTVELDHADGKAVIAQQMVTPRQAIEATIVDAKKNSKSEFYKAYNPFLWPATPPIPTPTPMINEGVTNPSSLGGVR